MTPPTRTDDVTLHTNNAGEIAVMDEGVDSQHLKQFSAVKPDRQSLYNPPTFAAINMAEADADDNYPIGISMHAQVPRDWSIMAGSDWALVWTFQNNGQDGTFQIAVIWIGGTNRFYMRASDKAAGFNWSAWQEISAINAINALATQTDADLTAHDAATGDVHGIVAPDTIESSDGAQAKVDTHAAVDASTAETGHVKKTAAIGDLVIADLPFVAAPVGVDTIDRSELNTQLVVFRQALNDRLQTAGGVNGAVQQKVNDMLAALRAAGIMEE